MALSSLVNILITHFSRMCTAACCRMFVVYQTTTSVSPPLAASRAPGPTWSYSATSARASPRTTWSCSRWAIYMQRRIWNANLLYLVFREAFVTPLMTWSVIPWSRSPWDIIDSPSNNALTSLALTLATLLLALLLDYICILIINMYIFRLK